MDKFDRNLVDVAWVLMALFILFTIGSFVLDVKAIGPDETAIGYSALNGAFHNLVGVHEGIDKLCDLFLVISLIPGAIGVYMGIKQLKSGRKVLQVDRAILALGVMYVVLLAIYLLFELFPANFRPVVLSGDNGPEASFPSSHTLFACTIAGCVYAVAQIRFYRMPIGRILSLVAIVVFALAIVLRLASGVHWFSDIFASVLLSCSLACFYGAAIEEKPNQ